MKLRNFRTFLVFCASLLFIIWFTLWNFSEQKVKHIFLVKIIPLQLEDDRADGLFEESYYWLTKKFLFPQTEIPEPLPKGIPTFERFIHVFLEKNGKLLIDSQQFGNLENINPFTRKLNEVFSEREKNGVFEPKSNKILKAVIIKARRSDKYGDVIKVIDAVKSSGADPIVLQIDLGE